MKIPGSALDIYIKDTYLAISKRSLIAEILVLLVAPLVAFTSKLLRSRHT